MKSFFIIRIFIYIFFIIHIVLSINKVEVFPVYGWDLYPYTHPYQNLYIVKVISKNHKTPVSLHNYVGRSKYYINRALRSLGARLDKYNHNKNSKEFKRAKASLEKYILKHMKAPLSYQLIKQKVNLPFYVLSKENSVVSEKTVIKGAL